MHKSQKIFLSGSVVLILLIIFFFFYPVLLAPSKYFFGIGGDGIKNYFTALYYLKFDDGLHFSAMNYPFGEQIVFTDNQPILSILLKSIFKFTGFNENYVIATFNIAMLLSLVISTIFIYLICIHFQVKAWLACFASLIITCLSPQLSRFLGHYGLAYVCFFPILWYLLIQLLDKKRKTILPVFIIVNFGFGITHLYYFAIGALFIVGCLLHIIFEDKKRWKEALIILSATVLPLILFQVILKLSDNVTDRHRNPYGIYVYRSYLTSYFLPFLDAEKNMVSTFFNYSNTEGEGRAYVGLAAVFVVLQYFIFRISAFIKETIFDKAFNKYLFAGLCCFAFSMCLPYTIGLSGLTKIVPFLAQFRSLGRFSWAFYFVFTISATIILNYFLELFNKYKFVKYEVVVIILLLWSFEAYQQIQNVSDQVIQNGKVARSNFFDCKYKYELLKIHKSRKDFQALLVFPFFNVGNEEWTNIRDDAGLFTAIHASYNLHLPVIESALSRTSISQSASLIQLMSGELIKKTILSKINNKPFLLISVNGKTNEDENRIISKAIKLTDNGIYSMYELPVGAFSNSINRTIKWFYENKNKLYVMKNNDSVFSTLPQTFYQYDYQYKLKKSKIFTLLKIPLKKIEHNRSLEFSVWLKITDAHAVFPVIECKGYYKNDTTYNAEGIGYSTDIYKNYTRAKIIIHPQDTSGVLEFRLAGKDIIPGKMLLRNLNNDVFLLQKSGMIMKNNFYLDDNVNLFDGFKTKE